LFCKTDRNVLSGISDHINFGRKFCIVLAPSGFDKTVAPLIVFNKSNEKGFLKIIIFAKKV